MQGEGSVNNSGDSSRKITSALRIGIPTVSRVRPTFLSGSAQKKLTVVVVVVFGVFAADSVKVRLS